MSSHYTYPNSVMCSNYGGAEMKMIRGGEEGLQRPLSGSEAAKMVGVVELEEEQCGRASESGDGGDAK